MGTNPQVGPMWRRRLLSLLESGFLVGAEALKRAVETDGGRMGPRGGEQSTQGGLLEEDGWACIQIRTGPSQRRLPGGRAGSRPRPAGPADLQWLACPLASVAGVGATYTTVGSEQGRFDDVDRPPASSGWRERERMDGWVQGCH